MSSPGAATSVDSKRRKLNESEQKGWARVFVGNLPLPQNAVSPEAFIEWFETAVRAKVTEADRKARTALGHPEGPERYTDGIENWSVDEGICFVKIAHPEDAFIALRVSGQTFKGQPISVCLPQCLPDPIYMALPFTQVDVLPNPRLSLSRWRGRFVVFAEIPQNTAEADIRALFEALGGPLESLWCYKEDGFFKGCGRLALINSLVTESVVQRLNNAPVGQNILRIASLLPDNRKTPTIINGAPTMFNFEGETVPHVPISAQLLADPVIALQMRSGRTMGGIPSRIVQLHNIVPIEDLLCDELLNELLAEVRKEASTFGRLESVIAPRPIRKSDIHTSTGCGKIFLEYSDTTSARKAQFEFNGRLFDDRVVCAAFYPLLAFELKRYSLLVP